MKQSVKMIDFLTAEQVFDAVIRIQVCQEKSLEVDFFPDRVRVRLPPKRVLALSCSVPMSKMTAILSEMERDHLIGTEQLGGMWATLSEIGSSLVVLQGNTEKMLMPCLGR